MSSWSMKRRLLLSLTGAIGALWISGVVMTAFMIRHEIDEVFDSALQETAQRILPLAAYDLSRRGEDEQERVRLGRSTAEDHKESILYQVRDPAGRVLLRSHDAPERPFSAPMKRGHFDDGERRYFTEWSADGSLVIQVAELPHERAEAVRALWLGLLVPLLFVLPIAAVAVRATVNRVIEPVRHLQQELGARNGAHLDPLDGKGLPAELAPVANDVNRLLSRLSLALESERAFASNSAHELRNPIAAAQAQAELLADAAEDEEQRRRAEGLKVTLATLNRRIEALLQLARTESGMALARESMSLRDLVELLMDDWLRKPQCMNRIRFDNSAVDPILITANADALGIAIENLIGNAVKHSPEGTPITVRLGPGAVLSVVNDGSLMGADDVARLKQRFARGFSGATDGSGLGLYIADTIARQSGARLDLYSPARGQNIGFEAVLSW